MFADVFIEDAFLGNQMLTYRVGKLKVQVGTRVEVTVRSRKRVAFVMALHDQEPSSFEVSDIVGVIDENPIIDTQLYDLAYWLSATTLSPMIRCLQTILPNKLKPKSSAKQAKTQRIIRRTNLPIGKVTKTQMAFLERFELDMTMSVKEASDIFSNFRLLIDQGYFTLEDEEVVYEANVVAKTYTPHTLTPQQETVIQSVDLTRQETYLLHGVTGSGKTEIYLQLASKVLDQGKQVLILVPEISLTPQMIERVSSRFGTDVAIYHSGLNDQEKYEQYMRVRNQDVKVIVGTRSAVFMPFQNLGLMVMDEEHDTSYKQEVTPFYHTRDVAIYRTEVFNCPLILGSASPSLESYARALRKNYTLLELTDRINLQFPHVTLIDTRQALKQRQSAYLSDTLLEGIQKRLLAKQQVILLLNRRGYMTLLKDANGNVIECPHCDVSLNYHKQDDMLRCHVCDFQKKRDQFNTNFVGSGVGTQRLQEHLGKLFPQARIARMDRDNTQAKNAHEKILKAFENYEFDIMIGTQMIAKGLDIEKVTLVGIVNADTSLAHTDYRAVEQTFNLLLQATGRAGRGRYPGEVMIQTSNPDHYAIQCAVHQKYKHFFAQEMSYRKLANYPPYRYLIALYFRGEDETKVMQAANDFLNLDMRSPYKAIGPSYLGKRANAHRSRIIYQDKDLEGMRKHLSHLLEHYQKINRTGVSVDVNPLTLDTI